MVEILEPLWELEVIQGRGFSGVSKARPSDFFI